MQSEKVLIFTGDSAKWKAVYTLADTEAREYEALKAAQNGEPAAYVLDMFFVLPHNNLMIYNESEIIKTIREDGQKRLITISSLRDRVFELEEENRKLKGKKWWQKR